jgi:cyanate permease
VEVACRHAERNQALLIIGIYLTALSLGAVTGSLLSVPLYQASGGSVRLVLGWIALPAALATLLWLTGPQRPAVLQGSQPARLRG